MIINPYILSNQDQVSNTGYFVFNLIHFSVKSSITRKISNTRYFNFNIFNLNVIYIFFIISITLPKPTGRGTNLSISNLSTLVFKFPELVATFLNLSISNLSRSDFNFILI